MHDFLAIQTQTAWGKVLESFAEWCQPQPGWACLDVGCGPGLLPALLVRRGCHAVGVDMDVAALTQARLHPLLVSADALNLPFATGGFQLVTATNLLFLLDPRAGLPVRALQAMRRALAPDGQIALLNPSEHMSLAAATALAERRELSGVARLSLLNWAARAEAGQRWDEDSLRALLAGAGLQLVETELRVGPGLARFARAVPA